MRPPSFSVINLPLSGFISAPTTPSDSNTPQGDFPDVLILLVLAGWVVQSQVTWSNGGQTPVNFEALEMMDTAASDPCTVATKIMMLFYLPRRLYQMALIRSLISQDLKLAQHAQGLHPVAHTQVDTAVGA